MCLNLRVFVVCKGRRGDGRSTRRKPHTSGENRTELSQSTISTPLSRFVVHGITPALSKRGVHCSAGLRATALREGPVTSIGNKPRATAPEVGMRDGRCSALLEVVRHTTAKVHDDGEEEDEDENVAASHATRAPGLRGRVRVGTHRHGGEVLVARAISDRVNVVRHREVDEAPTLVRVEGELCESSVEADVLEHRIPLKKNDLRVRWSV